MFWCWFVYFDCLEEIEVIDFIMDEVVGEDVGEVIV